MKTYPVTSFCHTILRTRLSWWRGTNHHSPTTVFPSFLELFLYAKNITSGPERILPFITSSPCSLDHRFQRKPSCQLNPPWLSFVFTANRTSSLASSFVAEVIVPRSLSHPLYYFWTTFISIQSFKPTDCLLSLATTYFRLSNYAENALAITNGESNI